MRCSSWGADAGRVGFSSPAFKRSICASQGRVQNDLKSTYINIEGFLYKFLKIKSALKSTAEIYSNFFGLEKSLNLSIFFWTIIVLFMKT